MRLFLLPISTRRTLIYCQRLNVTTSEQNGWLDKGTAKAASLWADWEKKESGWQRKVVDYGNQALKRIPYEEWGLKSIPPLSSRRKEEELSAKSSIEVTFPSTLIAEEDITKVLQTLGTERQALHKQRLIYSVIGMPLVAPFALVPVVPNLPFFYLVFRAWSHWRALSGGKHIEFLLDKKLITPRASPILNELYANGRKTPFSPAPVSSDKTSASLPEETMIMHKSDGKRIAEALAIPELYIELDRAVDQVEAALKAKEELKEEKKEMEAVKSKSEKKE